ncbi:MAG: hypothetical protein M3072_13130, partial [Candidatus Dormibacteraeota bacterium]|nr:hypothetical protein [Candidatus Dormibacteraeota bacterium]
DILAAEVSWAQIMRRARAFGPVPLGELLLDQRVCCGIGNVYKCEALWTLGLDPWLMSDALTEERLTQLFATARQAMQANLGGGFERRFEGGRARAVHGRRGRPCPRCGTAVATRQQGEQGRWTYFCRNCQRTATSGPLPVL